METYQKIPNQNESDITLKEVFQVIEVYWRLLWNNKYKLVYFLIPVACIYAILYITDKPLYKAEVTFMINAEEGGGSSLGGLLGQFGFGDASGKFNQNKVPYLVTSDRILRKTLFDTCQINGKTDFLINFILDEYKLPEKWSEDNPELKDYRFSKPVFDLQNEENDVYRNVVNFLLSNDPQLLASNFNKDISVFSISTSTTSEDLSIQMANTAYDELSEYYVFKSIERQKQAFELVKNKKDSIEVKLREVQYSIANFSDQNKSTWSSKNNVQRSFLEQERLKLGAMLQEVVKNYELADYSLKSQTPFFQVIDRPYSPLQPEQMSLKKSIIMIIVISASLFIVFIIGRQIIIDNT